MEKINDLDDLDGMTILEFPVQDRQGTPYTCGADCVQKVMEYYGEDYREMDLAEMLKSDPEHGTYVKNIVEFFHKHGLKAVVRQKMTVHSLIKQIDRKIPVIIMIQAWGSRENFEKNYRHDWEDGHFVVVIGYTADLILIADPALFNTGYIPKAELKARWHDTDEGDTRTYQLGISVYGKKPRFDEDKVERVK
ncbi:MAG: C39 family peptidase [Bacteroidetes bacterium]|nr:C39 family peptidase [Bacteroidota bacterium]